MGGKVYWVYFDKAYTHTHTAIAADVIYIRDPEGRRHFFVCVVYGTVNTNTRNPFNLDIYDICTYSTYNFIRVCFGAEEHT